VQAEAMAVNAAAASVKFRTLRETFFFLNSKIKIHVMTRIKMPMANAPASGEAFQ